MTFEKDDVVAITHPTLKGNKLEGIVEVSGGINNAMTRVTIPHFNTKGVWFYNKQLTKVEQTKK